MTFVDWRDADAETVAALYTAEARRWRDVLGWDTEASWAVVEGGRTRGCVPGWILQDASGAARGWTYYILHDGQLQIGGLTAAKATDLRRLLDRVLESPEATLASSVTGFVFPAPPSLVSALTRRRFSVRRSLYLWRDLAGEIEAAGSPPGIRIRAFTERDIFPAGRLLAQAYEDVPGAECFAPHGRLDEWVRYLRQLIESPACGHWQREASFVAEDAGDRRLVGLVAGTALSDTTGHIAQLVVARSARGLGVGDALIASALQAARRDGRTAMTLMVDAENTPARRLYARQGFTERSCFVYGRRRGQLRRPVATPAVGKAG